MDPEALSFVPVRSAVRLALPAAGAAATPSTLAFSVAKAGSTLLFEMLRALSQTVGSAYFEPEAALFAAGRDPLDRPVEVGFEYPATGYCFGGYRQFPAHAIPLLEHAPTVLLVRDPRDLIVSLYFSLVGSHVLPADDAEGRNAMREVRAWASKLTLSEFLWSGILQYTRMFEGYVANRFHGRANVKVYRYEDVIYRKAEFLRDVADWFGWRPSPEAVASIAHHADIRPATEQGGAHVRQIHPGNYKAHMTPLEARQVANDLREYMSIFGYRD